jgi:hypothetical protein
MKNYIALFLAVIIVGCGSTANFPVNVGLQCDCEPSIEMTEAIGAIAIGQRFVPDKSRPLGKTRYSSDIAIFQGPPASRLSMFLLQQDGKFVIIIADPSNGGKFSQFQTKIIADIESKIFHRFAGKFHECHTDFKQNIVCAIDSGI